MNVNKDELLKVVKLASQIILENGGETYRAEETIKFICKSLGVKEIDSVATPTGIYITLSIDGIENNTVVKRINKRSINLIRLNRVNTISRQITEKSISLQEAIALLEETRADAENYNKNFSLFYGGISAAFFTLLFGGKLLEFFISLTAGVLVALFAKKFENLHSYQFLSSLLAGTIIAFTAIAGTYIAGFGNYNYVIVGGMMPQLPGLAMTNAIRDTIRGDLVSGIARGTEALLVASSLAAGAGVIISFALYLGIIQN
ncbi:MAG: threonine/serine exporter family protein [Tissierellia bacterium]|nr:threonine/serine exporter family protein [Tissierellia bacterium]